jgi:hypothetical protein
VRIYDQRDVKTAGAQEKIGGQINPLGGPAAGSMDVLGQADKGESRIVRYEDELPAARQRMMDDLSKEDIPPQYQEMVKTFYEK